MQDVQPQQNVLPDNMSFKRTEISQNSKIFVDKQHSSDKQIDSVIPQSLNGVEASYLSTSPQTTGYKVNILECSLGEEGNLDHSSASLLSQQQLVQQSHSSADNGVKFPPPKLVESGQKSNSPEIVSLKPPRNSSSNTDVLNQPMELLPNRNDSLNGISGQNENSSSRELMNDLVPHSESEILETKRKRGRPPKLKPVCEPLCARTVPYAWKNKTREQRLADFKLLLSSCADVEPQQQGSSMSNEKSALEKKTSLSHSSSHQDGTQPPETADQVASLSENGEFQHPHVSPDSGISTSGSPAPFSSNAMTSLSNLAPVSQLHHNEGPPTLEPIDINKSRQSAVNQMNCNISDYSPPLLLSREDKVSNSDVVPSSHLISLDTGSQSTQIHNGKGVVDNTLQKTGKKRVKQKEMKDAKEESEGCVNSASLNTSDQQLQPKKKRGRPKGSLNKKNQQKHTDVEESQNNSAKMHLIPQLPLGFPKPLMGLHPYPYLVPKASDQNIGNMTEYILDNIFERFQAEKSSNKDTDKQVENSTVNTSGSAIATKLNTEKLSNYSKSSISSKLNTALKINSETINKSDFLNKNSHGEPQIDGLPSKTNQKGKRGRPRKYPALTGTKDPKMNKSSNSGTSRNDASSESLATFTNTPPQSLPNCIQSAWLGGCMDSSSNNILSLHKSDVDSGSSTNYNIGPPVLFSEESQSPDSNMPKSKAGDEFDKLMHSLHHVHAKISSKFHRRLSELDQTEDTATTDSESELNSAYTDLDLDSKSHKLVPKIRKAKFVSPPKTKKSKKKPHKSLAPPIKVQCDSKFTLPPSAFAFHKMSDISSCHQSFSNEHDFLVDQNKSPIQENNFCHDLGHNSEQLDLSSLAQHMSPSSHTGSVVSPLSRDSDIVFETRKRLKRKKSKHFKSKHKNVVDPVFVAEVDNLATVIDNMQISMHAKSNDMVATKVPVTFHVEQDMVQSSMKKDCSETLSKQNRSSKNKRGRKRRQIQDGLDMAKKKNFPFWLKKKVNLSDAKLDNKVEVIKKRGRGRPRKVPLATPQLTPVSDKGISFTSQQCNYVNCCIFLRK